MLAAGTGPGEKRRPKMNWKRGALTTVLVVAGLALSGCFSGSFHLEIHEDGSSDVRVGMGVDSALAGMAGVRDQNWFEEFVDDPDVVTEKTVENGMDWQYASQSLATPEELQARLDELEWGEVTVLRETGLLYNTFEFRVKGTEAMVTEEDVADLGEMFSAEDLSGLVTLTAEVILPGEVVEHNGDNVDDETNLITWYVDASEVIDIYARSRVLNIWTLVAGAALLLGLSVVAIGVVVAGIVFALRGRGAA
jgi:hypothetical protein